MILHCESVTTLGIELLSQLKNDIDLFRRLLSRAFRIYMTEEELRERDCIALWSFNDDELLTSYDTFMEFVDRTKGSYKHVCTEGVFFQHLRKYKIERRLKHSKNTTFSRLDCVET